MIPPPPPKMDALLYWMNTPPDPTLASNEKVEQIKASDVGEQLRHLEEKCTPYLQKLEASKNSWRAAKRAPYPSETEINQKRAQIQADAWHYKFCIAGNVCANQCQVYSNCWKFADKALGEQNMRALAQNQALDSICRPEREMIERCLGRIVANAVETSFSLDPQSSSLAEDALNNNQLGV